MGAKLSQHFLVDAEAPHAIVSAAGVLEGDRVLEIGPGRGALTEALLSAGAIVTAVEYDAMFFESLPARLKKPANLTVIHADFLDFDLRELGAGPWRVAGNLPYAVASAILRKVLEWSEWSTAALMFQKEVALRIAAEPGGADFGLLSLATALRAQAELAFELPPEAFRPRPKVDSAVVALRRLPAPLLDAEREKIFWRIAKAAFEQRRKMAAGVIAGALHIGRDKVEEALSRAGVPEDARPERISVDQWIALATEFSCAR